MYIICECGCMVGEELEVYLTVLRIYLLSGESFCFKNPKMNSCHKRCLKGWFNLILRRHCLEVVKYKNLKLNQVYWGILSVDMLSFKGLRYNKVCYVKTLRGTPSSETKERKPEKLGELRQRLLHRWASRVRKTRSTANLRTDILFYFNLWPISCWLSTIRLLVHFVWIS